MAPPLAIILSGVLAGATYMNAIPTDPSPTSSPYERIVDRACTLPKATAVLLPVKPSPRP